MHVVVAEKHMEHQGAKNVVQHTSTNNASENTDD
jgi:hypothetical protein